MNFGRENDNYPEAGQKQGLHLLSCFKTKKMGNQQYNFTLVNVQNGHLAFKILPFEDNTHFDHMQRNNYYAMIWVQQGEAKLKADFSSYDIKADCLLSFSPYQPYMLQTNKPIKGVAIFFHPDFFCIHKHHNEVACNGVLFNNIYQPPYIAIDEKARDNFRLIVEQMKMEIVKPGLAQSELLIAYLKIFLISASRLKTEQNSEARQTVSDKKEHFILQSLKEAIESNYKEKHAASDYAAILNITPKALAKITKVHLNKTLTSLISERIVIEAKRELYLTNKSVKQIAYELGYADEYYFSRFFKTNADVSPQVYRDTVGFDRQSVA